MDKHDFSGIEVSAEELIVAVEREGRTVPLECFANDAPGHQALLRFLRGAGHPVRVCMESTGVYGLDLALVLARAGIEVMVANPRATRHFATAMMQRSKNDRLDAWVLMEFAKRMPFQAWAPPRTVVLQLHALSRRLEALKDTRATNTTPADPSGHHLREDHCSFGPSSRAEPEECSRFPGWSVAPLLLPRRSGV